MADRVLCCPFIHDRIVAMIYLGIAVGLAAAWAIYGFILICGDMDGEW